MPRSYTRADIAGTIDHSVLQPQLTTTDALNSILLGREFGARSCCVRPCDVALAKQLLADSTTLVCTVIGFPHGTSSSSVKAQEARQALADGAVELDMVLNIGKLRDGDEAYVAADIAAVVSVANAHSPPALVKGKDGVILENAYLNDEEKVRGCRLIEAAGAEFAKTSTGFAVVTGDKAQGATVADLTLMRETCGAGVQVKAAGGVRTLDGLLAVLAAGATRVGATATKAILTEFDQRAVGGVLVVEEGGTTNGVGGGY